MAKVLKKTVVDMVALAFGGPGQVAEAIDRDNPLPVAIAASQAPSVAAPLVGSANASGSAGPFAPQLGRPIIITLSGNWVGSVQLLRSVDGGATKTPLTVGGSAWGTFTGNCNEPVWEETEAGVTFYLAIIRTSGTINYRVAQ